MSASEESLLILKFYRFWEEKGIEKIFLRLLKEHGFYPQYVKLISKYENGKFGFMREHLKSMLCRWPYNAILIYSDFSRQKIKGFSYTSNLLKKDFKFLSEAYIFEIVRLYFYFFTGGQYFLNSDKSVILRHFIKDVHENIFKKGKIKAAIKKRFYLIKLYLSF